VSRLILKKGFNTEDTELKEFHREKEALRLEVSRLILKKGFNTEDTELKEFHGEKELKGEASL
jgi:hypothetical protein